jgi:hypothetical protein
LILRYRAAIALAVSAVLAPPAASAAKTSPPRWWVKEAMCIHEHESVDWHRVTDWLGQPSWDHGGMQIDVRTWEQFAQRPLPSDPADATPREQLVVAYRIWRANGRRFGGGEWPLSSVRCGLE